MTILPATLFPQYLISMHNFNHTQLHNNTKPKERYLQTKILGILVLKKSITDLQKVN